MSIFDFSSPTLKNAAFSFVKRHLDSEGLISLYMYFNDDNEPVITYFKNMAVGVVGDISEPKALIFDKDYADIVNQLNEQIKWLKNELQKANQKLIENESTK